MHRFSSSGQVEALLADTSVLGASEASAPRVARLLSAMDSPPAPAEPWLEHQAVAAIVAAIRQAPRPPAAHRRSRSLHRRDR